MGNFELTIFFILGSDLENENANICHKGVQKFAQNLLSLIG